MVDTRARNGAPLPLPVAGAYAQCSRAPSIGVSGFVPLWARSIFSWSCVVVRAWCLEFGGAASGGSAISQYRQTLFIINKRFGDRALRRMLTSHPFDANRCLSDANGCDFGKADVI